MTAHKSVKLMVLACGVLVAAPAMASQGDAKRVKADAVAAAPAASVAKPVAVAAPVIARPTCVSKDTKENFADAKKQLEFRAARHYVEANLNKEYNAAEVKADKAVRAAAVAQDAFDKAKGTAREKEAGVELENANKARAVAQKELAAKETECKRKAAEIVLMEQQLNKKPKTWAQAVKESANNAYCSFWGSQGWKRRVLHVTGVLGVAAASYYVWTTLTAEQTDDEA